MSLTHRPSFSVSLVDHTREPSLQGCLAILPVMLTRSGGSNLFGTRVLGDVAASRATPSAYSLLLAYRNMLYMNDEPYTKYEDE